MQLLIWIDWFLSIWLDDFTDVQEDMENSSAENFNDQYENCEEKSSGEF